MISTVIRQRRKELGLTLAQLAERVGVSEPTVQRWESGAIKNLRHDKIVRLANALQMQPTQLMGWEGGGDILKIRNFESLPQTAKAVPLVGAIACGLPILADENIEFYVPLPENMQADFCLRCRGNSMIQARLHDGDLVYIQGQPTVENGEIAAVLIGDEATLKRVYQYEDRLELHPENPIFPIETFKGKEMNNVRIMGKAIGFISSLGPENRR